MEDEPLFDEDGKRFVRQAASDKKRLRLNCLSFPGEPEKDGIYLETEDGSQRYRLNEFQTFALILKGIRVADNA